MAAMNLLVNGKRHTVGAEPSTPLLYILRNDLDLAGSRFGCGLGHEGGLLHSVSRVLHEEVRFDEAKVLSVDWVSSPTLTHADVPEGIDIIHVNGDPKPDRPDLRHYGAGETVCKPMMAAVANAVFDARGVRMRRVPFTAARVLAALKA